MGATGSKDNEADQDFVSLSYSDNSKRIKIPLNQSLDIRLVPKFTTTDKPGKSVQHHLEIKLERDTHMNGYSARRQPTNCDYKAFISLRELTTSEEKIVLLRDRRKKSIKQNMWQGYSDRLTNADSRLSLSGHIENIQGSGKSKLSFDLILCPSDLIIPNSSDQWLVVGSFYVKNLSDGKEYKWRAAVERTCIDGKKVT